MASAVCCFIESFEDVAKMPELRGDHGRQKGWLPCLLAPAKFVGAIFAHLRGISAQIE
jgi:hypothetical protein